jgi:DNA helicase-2/ATP-dependent DNA helicase PcrA
MKPNPQQQLVIDHVDGPCLVTAVPGSGKTASVTERIKRLVSIGKHPSTILAITFTNKAANEMRKRISEAVGQNVARSITVSTFHSMCARILRDHGSFIGIEKKFSIYDSDDQETLLKRCILQAWEDEDERIEKEFQSEIPKIEKEIEALPDGEEKDALLGRLRSMKAKLDELGSRSITPDYIRKILQFIEGKRNSCLEESAAVARYDLVNEQLDIANMYFRELANARSVDFTGLLSETIRLFKEQPRILSAYQARWKYINVDEVQDTNVAQYEIIKMLAARHRNLLVVGDYDQSIYAFRNANPENLIQFEKDFGAKWLKLEMNYRSTPQILERASELITRNSMRKETELKTENGRGVSPRAYWHEDDEYMAADMAEKVRSLILNGAPPNEVAILYRINFASRVLEHALRRRRIKYKIIGGFSFFERKEIKTSLSILRLLVNADDRAAFERVVGVCCKGVGVKTVDKIFVRGVTDKVPVLEAARREASKATKLAKKIAVLTDNLDTGIPAADALMLVTNKTAFGDKMAQDSTKDNNRLENIRELAADVRIFMSDGKSLADYLQYVALVTSSDDESSGEEISLMTMHASKGLEFDNILISHANEDIIPHKSALMVEDANERKRQLEEERRLMYVAMTRARKTLSVYSCDRIVTRKNDGYLPSRFIHESGIHAQKVTTWEK